MSKRNRRKLRAFLKKKADEELALPDKVATNKAEVAEPVDNDDLPWWNTDKKYNGYSPRNLYSNYETKAANLTEKQKDIYRKYASHTSGVRLWEVSELINDKYEDLYSGRDGNWFSLY
jgi:hypothetical protein